MMLQALIAYAERENLGDPDFEAASIHWLIPLTSTGKLSSDPIPLYDDPTVKKPQPKKLLRAFTSPNELNQGDKSHFLADSLERTVLMPNPKAPEKAVGRRVQHAYFKKLLTEASVAVPAAAAKLGALLTFLADETELSRLHAALATAKAKPTDNATFEIAGEKLLDDPALKAFWRTRRAARRASNTRSTRVCIATGQLTETLDTTEKIKGVPGDTMGLNLISCNEASFTSYGLEKAQNAAISAPAELKMRAALNALLAVGHPIGKAKHLHWTREAASTDLFALLTSADEADVKNLLTAAQTGIAPASITPNAYYAMSVSGNGRIIVRDWLESTVPEVEAHVRRWFSDLTIIAPDGTHEQNAFKLGRLLFATVRKEIDELPPQIPTQLLYSALRGTPPPQTALAAALRRQHIETREKNDKFDPKLNPARIALIKLCLIRSPNRKKHHTMTEKLDPKSRDSAYLCGQLFAVIGRLQLLALGKIGASIAERTYGGVATRPASTFGPLFTKLPAYLKKANTRFPGSGTNKLKELEALSVRIDGTGGFPRTLGLEEQGRFALGYYCQLSQYRTDRAEADAADKAELLPDDPI